MCWSFAEIHTLSSTTNNKRSDSFIIFSIKGTSSEKSKSHGLSKKVSFHRLSTSIWWTMISVVVQWISVTIALNCPIKRLNSVDFHALVAPISQIFIFFIQLR